MQITLSDLKTTATRHAERLRKAASILTLDLIVEEEVANAEAERDEAKHHAEAVESIAIVAGMVEALPAAFSLEAIEAFEDVVRQAEAFLARESTRATLARAAEFERDLPY